MATRRRSATRWTSSTRSSTTRASADDYLKDVPTAVHWLQDHALLHREMVEDLLTKYETEDGTPLMNRIWRTARLSASCSTRPLNVAGRSAAALREVNRALKAHYLIELVPASDGVSLDHRHEGDPVNGAMADCRGDRARADAGRAKTAAHLRQRRVSLGLPRLLAGRPAQVVRHVHLRQSGQGRAPPRTPEGEGRRARFGRSANAADLAPTPDAAARWHCPRNVRLVSHISH